jgi:hypothetical protein
MQSYFVDKASALALSSGTVTFYEDTNRISLKPVYQITGSPGSYTFVALPNPLILSGIGTFVDNSGANIQPYYFPYQGTPSSSTGQVDLYFVSVANSGSMFQFSLMAQPYLSSLNAPYMNSAIINFGSTPVSKGIFTIIDSGVSVGDQIIAQVVYTGVGGKSQDECEFDSIDLQCLAGTGQFSVLAKPNSGNPVSLVSGSFQINYVVS